MDARARLDRSLATDPAAAGRAVFGAPRGLLAALGVTSSWSIGGLFLSLEPQLAGSLFHTTSSLVAGVSVFALAAPAAIAQLVCRRTAPWAGGAVGSVALAGGMVAIVLAAATGSSALYLAGALVGAPASGRRSLVRCALCRRRSRPHSGAR